VALVEQAQMGKAPMQRLVDRVSAYFVWGVMAVAIVTCGVWCWLVHDHQDWLMALRMGVGVLVVACPCALGLATPTAIAMGTGLAAKRGIVIKGAEVLEQISQLDMVIFDKTGTLTHGKPQVTDLIPAEGISPAELIQLAASAEAQSNHPLGRAILQAMDAHQTPLTIVSSTNHVGGGVESLLADGRLVKVGSDRWLNLDLPDLVKQHCQELQKAGKTTVSVAVNQQWMGTIALQDQLKPDAQQTINQLEAMGLTTAMITGDRAATAQAIAQNLGIKHCWAETTPEGKSALVAKLQQQGKRVAMVGDGINDAPALAQADVGIAVGSGLDIALETASVVLMSQSELTSLVTALKLGQATFRKIYQNLGWAFAYNLISVPIAAGALSPWGITLTPAIAALGMAFSSVSVVLNSLSLGWLL
jgi:heavy metal translocating P-type ATPase